MKLGNCSVCRGPEIYGKLPQIIDAQYWRVKLNPKQQFLRRTFIGLREHKPDTSSLTEEEVLELHRIKSALEVGARAAFGSSISNFLCLMNDAARDGQSTHMHEHFIPRYDGARRFMEHIYIDDVYGNHYNLSRQPNYPPKDKQELRHGVIALTARALQYGIYQDEVYRNMLPTDVRRLFDDGHIDLSDLVVER